MKITLISVLLIAGQAFAGPINPEVFKGHFPKDWQGLTFAQSSVNNNRQKKQGFVGYNFDYFVNKATKEKISFMVYDYGRDLTHAEMPKEIEYNNINPKKGMPVEVRGYKGTAFFQDKKVSSIILFIDKQVAVVLRSGKDNLIPLDKLQPYLEKVELERFDKSKNPGIVASN